MIGNYIKIAIRNLKKYKGFAFVNISGLAIGLAVCILIFLFVQYESGFDSHVHDKDKVYRVVTHETGPNGIEYGGGVPHPLAEAIRSDLPNIDLVTKVYHESNIIIGVETDRFKEDHVLYVDIQFFEFFDIDWILGDIGQAWDDPQAVVLTQTLATKYFGDQNPLGQILQMENQLELHVTGIVADPPHRTSLPFNLLVSASALEDIKKKRLEQWDLINNANLTFVRIPDMLSAADIVAQFDALERKYMEPKYAERWSFSLQPFGDLHFDRRYGSYHYITSRNTLITFSIIGILILIIACINFINLTTAQAVKRAKEVGMRKVLGANRQQLMKQLLGETTLYVIISTVISIFLSWTILPHLNQFLGNDTQIQLSSHYGVLVFLVAALLFVITFNGLYPALVLSRFRPIDMMKEKLSTRKKSAYILRNGLVLVQFVISQILIVATLIISGQTSLINKMDLGFRKDGILAVTIPKYDETEAESLRARWMQNPNIKEVSFAWSSPTGSSNFSTSFVYEGSGETIESSIYIKMSDTRYLDVYEIPLVAGRFFNTNVGDEDNKQWVLNETAVAKMGLSDPFEAIGKRVNINDSNGEVIGVIKDFHAFSLRNEMIPTVFFNFWPANHRRAQIKISTGDLSGIVKHIQGICEEYYPGIIFEYQFFDDYLESLYLRELKMQSMMQIASFITIIIGCMGLLGLVSFMVLQRTKEIGIRKVLGASVQNVYVIISREFFKWILMANLVAWPVVYFLARDWLQSFAYRIPLTIKYFLFGGLISFVIALVIISYQVVRASMANPVDSLRYE